MFASTGKARGVRLGAAAVREAGANSVTIRATVEIEAPADRVWDVLADFVAYPAWNPFLTRIEGKLRRGARLAVTVVAAGRPAMIIRPRLLAVRRGRYLAWAGGVLAPGLFDGEHQIRLEPLSETRTLLNQEDCYSGVFAPMFCESLLTPARTGWDAMNQAAKARAEA